MSKHKNKLHQRNTIFYLVTRDNINFKFQANINSEWRSTRVILETWNMRIKLNRVFLYNAQHFSNALQDQTKKLEHWTSNIDVWLTNQFVHFFLNPLFLRRHKTLELIYQCCLKKFYQPDDKYNMQQVIRLEPKS